VVSTKITVENRGMDMVEVHYHSVSHQPEVEDIDREDRDMREDMTVEVEVIEREHENVMLVKHWTGDGTERHRQCCRELEELAKSGWSEGHTKFTSRDSNYSI
jgi:hypothetical protein